MMALNVPLVSIIIPVYNSEQYLESCLLSVVNQTYKKIEVIIVNDGSTDRSADIINRFTCLDERIIFITKQNDGPALARKCGLDKAIGKYIQFLDSDDTLFPSAIELLVRKAEQTNADIVAFPFFLCDFGGSKQLSSRLEFHELDGVAYLKEIFNNKAYWSLWSNFQKRSLYLDYHLDIVPGIFFGEDAIWMTQILLNAPKVVSIDQRLLNYNRNLSSLSNKSDIALERYQSFRAFQIWIENYIEQKGLTDSFKKELALQHLQTIVTNIHWRQLQDIKADIKRAIRDLKQYPDLKKILSRRERKMIALYRIAHFAGHYYMMNCVKKDKM